MNTTDASPSRNSAQLDAWRGSFGETYIGRNAMDVQRLRRLTAAYAEILRWMAEDEPKSILEVGCNIGMNLHVLDRLTGARLFGLEPNGSARAELASSGLLPADQILDATAEEIPLADGSVDLVFTSGVLIHIHPDRLEQAMREVLRVAGKYVLAIEYFNDKPVSIPYRGRDDLLFKRDFGKTYLELDPTLRPVAQGFFWKEVTGLDNLTWWLFRR